MRIQRNCAPIVAVLVLAGCVDEVVRPVLQFPATIEIVSGNDQIQGRERNLNEPIVVRALDESQLPMSEVTLIFEPGPGSGSVDVAAAVTDASGEVTVNWRLGDAADPQTLTVSAGAAARAEVTATARLGDFDVHLIVADPRFTVEQVQGFRAGVERWTDVIIGDLRDYDFPDSYVLTDECQGLQSLEVAHRGTVDDVRIVIDIGSRNAIAHCEQRPELPTGVTHPVLSYVTITERAWGLAADRSEEYMVHLVGHLLGFGWDWQGLIRNPVRRQGEGADTHFPDPQTVALFNAAGGVRWTGSKVPVENYGPYGNSDAHWRGDVVGHEVMSSWYNFPNPGDNPPLSVFTVQSMAALGYEVDLSMADPYTLPGVGQGARPAYPIRRHPAYPIHPRPDDAGFQETSGVTLDEIGRVITFGTRR